MKTYFKDLMVRYPNFWKISRNSFWLMADSLFRFGVGFLVSIWMARSLGPAQFGVYNFVLTCLSFLTAVMGLGLEVVVVRMLSRDPGVKDRLIPAALCFRLSVAFVVFIMLAVFLCFCQEMPLGTRWMVAVISLGLFFQCFDVIDYYFQSRLLSKYVVWVKSGVFSVVCFAKIFLIIINAPLIFFVIAALLEIVLGGVTLFLVFKMVDRGAVSWCSLDLKIVLDLFRQGWPLGLSGLGTCIYMRVDQFFMTQFLGNAPLGVYSAALRLSEMWYFIPMAVVTSIMPKVIELRQSDPVVYKVNLQKVYDHVFLLGFFFSIVLSLSSGFTIKLLFGQAYGAAAPVLAWHAWTGVFVGLGLVVNTWLIAEDKQHYILLKNLLAAGLSIVLNLLLVPLYGIVGAAMAAVVSYASAIFFLGCFSDGREGLVMCWRALYSFRDLVLAGRSRQ